MVVDGTVMDVPDSEANARVFGYPGLNPPRFQILGIFHIKLFI